LEYIIMADGQGSRWNGKEHKSKCAISIDGETLLARTVRLVRLFDADSRIVITTHDSSICVPNAEIWQPKNNQYEIDRFTAELLKPNVCYLYGDTFYTEAAMQLIVQTPADHVCFFGSREKIFAVKITDANLFRNCYQYVRELYIRQEIQEAIGWEIYHALHGMPIEGREIGPEYLILEDDTADFNTYQDYLIFQHKREAILGGNDLYG